MTRAAEIEREWLAIGFQPGGPAHVSPALVSVDNQFGDLERVMLRRGNTVCLSSPCFQGALEASSLADEQGRSVWCGGSRQRRNGWWQRLLWGESLRSHYRGLESTIGVVNEARDRAI